jgi:hypothetical protein
MATGLIAANAFMQIAFPCLGTLLFISKSLRRRRAIDSSHSSSLQRAIAADGCHDRGA